MRIALVENEQRIRQAARNLLLGGLRVIRVGVYQRGQPVRGRGLVFHIAGRGVNRIHLHGHGQLMQVAVIKHASARRYLDTALLLLGRTVLEFGVAHHLQPEQPAAYREGPQEKKQADEPEARPLEGDDAGRVIAASNGSNGCLHRESNSQLSALGS